MRLRARRFAPRRIVSNVGDDADNLAPECQGPFVMLIRLPIGSSFGKCWRAIVSLMIATGAAPWRHPAGKDASANQAELPIALK
jgi:hypothetical protein